MKRIWMKKITLFFFVFASIFIISDWIGLTETKGFDYQISSSWQGHDLGFSPQIDVLYDSEYRPFSDIIESVLTVDITKTYVIEDAYDLYYLSQLAKGADKSTYLSLDYVLGGNIDYYDIVQQNITYRFSPIGFVEPFSGTFDGQGYEITNLFFHSILFEEDYNLNYAGLRYTSMFSKVSATGVVKNLGLINPIIIQPIEWGIMDHVSTLVGANYGLIENTYMIDTRGNASGLSVEGQFRISGLVSINLGTISNSFVAAPHIRSNAVVNNLSTSAVVYANSGTLNNVYYDETIYADSAALTAPAVGLETYEFQDSSNFSSDWFFNDSYEELASIPSEIPQVTLEDTYPILQGLSVNNGILEIEDAVGFVYMNQLLLVSGYFRSSHYEIVFDIDMNGVSREAYQAASVGFNGVLSSSLASPASVLYTRNIDQGGDVLYHTILNLKIESASAVGNFSSYALFTSFFGTIENLNFVNFQILTSDLDQQVLKTKVVVGAIAGQMSNGHIENVHVQGDIIVTSTTDPMTKLYVGGLVGEGSGFMNTVSTNGNITQELQDYALKSNESSTGGLIGKSNDIMINSALSNNQMIGLGYNNINDATYYIGGIIGYGRVNSMSKIVNSGYIYSSDAAGYMGSIYAGGIIGMQTNQKGSITQVFNDGHIDVIENQPFTMTLAGYGYINGLLKDVDSDFTFYSITNAGRLRLVQPSGTTYSEIELGQITVDVAGVIIADSIDANFYGLFNESNFEFDLSLIEQYAGTLNLRNSSESSITQAYNTGNMTLVSLNLMTHDTIKISANILGQNLNLEHLRNEGNIAVEFDHSTTITNGNLYVYGLFEEVSQDMTAVNGYNGGNITITQDLAPTVGYHIFASGLAYRNSNTNYFLENMIDPTSINVSDVVGSMDNFINDGDVTILGSFNGNTKATGALIINESLLTSVVNLGNITNLNDIQIVNGELESAGIVDLMIGQYARVKDSANYGTISAVSSNANGYAQAAGIAVRNDRLENGSTVTTGTIHKYAKIMFSINYGDIYAYSNVDESLYTITSETRSKASGIFGQGLLSVVDVINYGNVYSKYLAGGIFGFVSLNAFGSIAQNQVYIANALNYGKIRAITAYDGSFTINMNTYPARTAYNAFGTFIGKFHTGATTWEFLSNSTYAIYPLDLINFGYYVNFDSLGNLLGNAPEITLDPKLTENGEGSELLLNILNKMSTINPTDTSVAPFRLFMLGVFPHIADYGKNITPYLLDDTLTGIFNENFIFRKPPVSYYGTDQYLKNYFTYLPRAKTSDALLAKIETDTSDVFTGIYALASSSGVGNGIYIPDHIDLESLHPQLLNSEPDITWLGVDTNPDSVIYKLTIGMRQIKDTYATTIYDLEVLQVDAFGEPIVDGLILKKPIIDEERGLITYYLPSNATILSSTSSYQITAYSYVEAGEGLGQMVPDTYENDEWTYKWVGNYKKTGDTYVPIGPYNTTGVRNVTYSDITEFITSKNRSDSVPNAVYNRYIQEAGASLNYVHIHFPHIKEYTTLNNFWWRQTGYTALSSSVVAAGYGPYKIVVPTFPPSYPVVYEYVGPSQELVTYVLTYVEGEEGIMTIYDDPGIYFQANLDDTTYIIASGASFYDNEQAMLEPATIPLSYGIYDAIYDGVTYELIDAVENHYGSVRVFSANYDELNPDTYRDYQIRIIRTADQSLTSLDLLYINGIDAMPTIVDFRDVTATEMIHYIANGIDGIMSFTYSTLNISNEYNVLPILTLFDNNTGVKVHTSLYRLDKGIVVTSGAFNNLYGTWGDGTVNVDFEVTDLLPSGSYRMELELVTGEIAKIYFDKIESANGFLLNIEYDGDILEPVSNSISSTIPFGIYYNPADLLTEIVNFTNIFTLSNVYFEDLIDDQIPDYLSSIEISPFATLVSLDLNITMIDLYRHQYQITYLIEAEDGTQYTYTHDLDEALVSATPEHVYQNGGDVDLPFTYLTISYSESPTIRVEFDFEHVYFPSNDQMVMTSLFTPENGSDEAVEGTDYFITILSSLGYEVDFGRDTPIGYYDIYASYDSSTFIWGENLTWTFTFDSITTRKVKNDDSHLNNVYFVSDTVFSGFDTIVDIAEITSLTYVGYLQYPETRLMSVLPTTGIYYGDYFDYATYWIIGQVQKTNLSAYLPSFVLPDGAIIRRVIDPVNIGYEYQSELLSADYTPIGEMFNFIQYRVYAHDYDEYTTHYTDYYIAIQDVTNNIKLNLTVVNSTDVEFDKIYVKVNVCQMGEEYTEECEYQDILISMSVFAYYQEDTDTYSNNQFQTTMYGTYLIYVDLPVGYGFTVAIQQVTIDGSAFYFEDSILPRKYYVTVTIIEEPAVIEWGHQEIYDYTPPVEQMKTAVTYVAGEMFLYNGITWLVQEGYTYLYNVATPPGTVGISLGLRDVSELYSSVSTYMIGDTILSEGIYYRALEDDLFDVEPDLTSVQNGQWFEISEFWLGYNIYEAGDIVDYSGILYIANYQNQNMNPFDYSDPGEAWSIYTP
ncbi:MAG: hypothetical protein ABII85_07500 [Bacillota bacterium]